MLPLTSQQKIQGTEIATGKAKWGDVGDGQLGYVFDNDEDFHWRVNPQTAIEMGVSEEDLLDCVDQIEEYYGSHQAVEMAFGMYPDQGYKNVGLVFVSRTNPNVRCFFSPTDSKLGWVGFFSWYFSKEGKQETLDQFIKSYDMLSGNRGTNILVSPVVPKYEEASEYLQTRKDVKSELKEAFLQKVWDFHKNVAPGFKARLGEEIIVEWTDLQKKTTETTATA